mgnify:CR=1 FL=1
MKTSHDADMLRVILDCIGRDSHTYDGGDNMPMAVRWLVSRFAEPLGELIAADGEWYDANVRPLYHRDQRGTPTSIHV